MEERHYLYWLASIPGIGAVKAGRLMEYYGNVRDIYMSEESELIFIEGISEKDAENIVSSRDEKRIVSSYEKILQSGIRMVFKGEPGYPMKLTNIYNAPYCLYYKGSLPDEDRPVVAVVGARNASYEGMQIAHKIGRELAELGVQIVSGLARGIDISGQRGALSVPEGRTYGIMGCGIDTCYPRQHIEEYMLIQQNGGIISEYAPGIKAYAGNFPMRNRIISGLSDGVLVIEAGEKSGSLITAELGMEQGKDVFVVPGSITNPLYCGSNSLIKQGAAVVTDTMDILDALGIFYDNNMQEKKRKNEVMLETSEKIVYASLSLEPVHISEIIQRTGLNTQKTMDLLISLEMKKLICMVGNNYYALKL